MQAYCSIDHFSDLVHDLVMREVDVDEENGELSRLLDQAMAGEDVILMRSERRQVRLTPVAFASPPRVLGSAKGDFVVPDDFDDPLL